MVIRIIISITILGLFLYLLIDRQNTIVSLRLQIPLLEQEVQRIEEKNTALQFEVEACENYQRLLQLKKNPEYRHLREPKPDEIIHMRRECP